MLRKSFYFDLFCFFSIIACLLLIAKGTYIDCSYYLPPVLYNEINSAVNAPEDIVVTDCGTADSSYRINVRETGDYCLYLRYLAKKSNSPQIEFSLKIDGAVPFSKSARLILKRTWTNEHDIYTDSRGNQVRPSQVQCETWQECFIRDPDGLSGEPLVFHLEKGVHEVSFESESEFELDFFSFCNPPSPEKYSAHNITPTDADVIRIEGENALYKSDAILSPTYDNSDCLVSPSDPVKVVYNTIGAGRTWENALQSLTWEFDAVESGWYRLGIKARQNQMRGLYSSRRIYIDGEVPYQELEQVRFFYGRKWSIVTPQTESGEDVYLYIEKGSHSITLECVTGEIGKSLQRLESVVDRLNECYSEIIMVTSPNPDKYTDYYVHEKIPDITERLSDISTELKNIQSEIETVSEGSEVALIGNMAVILDKCVKNPLKIPEYLWQIKENIVSVSALMYDYCKQPLEIDYMELAPYGRDFSVCNGTLFQECMFGLQSFIGSFFEDYTTLSDVTDKEAVEVWVASGRDNAQVIRELTESGFMAEYDVPVAVNLVSGGIIEASLSGREPDVALFVGGELPVNLASRGLLADVSQYSGFDTVSARFQENALTHYQYKDGTYGLPLTQSFAMMFCRTDILSTLSITSPPETWDDFMKILPEIQRNYMSVGLVLPSADISPATESGHTFAMLMLQQDKSYYNSDLTRSVLDSADAVQTFERWTDFYTDYGFSQSYDPFTRFRTGEYPIVIADYSFALQLESASPEIRGLWDFCPVPATLRFDGSLSHAVNSNTTGAVIFSTSDKKNDAWSYIKWLTQTDVQAQYGNRIEGIQGTMGRYQTANLNAMEMLSWSDSQLAQLKAQQSELAEIPITPASYAVTRNIMNAFRETVNSGENPRNTLIWYNKDINDELERKNRT
ncbi:MAG: extracellular solute-binding protein [Ruminococcus sp.]|nr:extracellular solute-binding protein [Ruminococcus sp.]